MSMEDILKEERKIMEVTHIKRSRTKDGIMQEYWLEFLGWVKQHNQKAKVREVEDFHPNRPYELHYDKEASEINFWRWYIDTKMEGK